MSIHPQMIPPVPEETARVAKATFRKGNIYMRMRDELGLMYEDVDFVALFSRRGQPAEPPWRLALVCVMQYVENLSDRQAAEAVRARLDWKYALSLELTDEGFDFTILSEFRNRLIDGAMELHLLDAMLEKFNEHNLLKARGRQRTDSTHVLAAVRMMNRLENLGETLRAALNSLAVVVPDWLQAQVSDEWFERYGRRVENYRLPKLDSEREALAHQIGEDGFHLLQAVYDVDAPGWLRNIPAVETLRRSWVQQFHATEPGQRIRWREHNDVPPSALLIHSPYDLEAQYSTKRSVTWLGYKLHLTEMCDDDCPHFITHVETTAATRSDDDVIDEIHAALEQKELLPKEHFVDGGYMAAEHLVNSRAQYDIELIGPVRTDHSWQAKAGDGFDHSNFQIDWEHQKVTCPQGHQSTKWQRGHDNTGQPLIKIRFRHSTCLSCPVRLQCTRSKSGPRELGLRPREQHLALQARRREQETPEFKTLYGKRAGIEGTISQGIRLSALRQARYIGLAKTRLQHILTAAAINIVRFDAWLTDTPFAQTRISRFKAIQPQAA